MASRLESAVASISPQTTVACPKCGTPVQLTEALAAPLIEATRAEYESKLKAQSDGFALRQEELEQKEQSAAEGIQRIAKREADLKRTSEEARAEIDAQRAQIAVEVARQTEAAVAKQLDERLAVEKRSIAEEEERRATLRFSDELARRDRNGKEQVERIERLSELLTKSQSAEAELRRREREFEDREREFPLKIEQEVSARLEEVRIRTTTPLR